MTGTPELKPLMLIWRHDTHHNDTQYNDNQHNDTQHNDIQLNHK
jgi:hypothetical protein